MDVLDSEWQRKGATLSNKTAEREFGLTWAETTAAIRAGKLQYREGSAPRQPLPAATPARGEALARDRRGDDGLRARQRTAELRQIEREVKGLNRQIALLEKRNLALLAGDAPELQNEPLAARPPG